MRDSNERCVFLHHASFYSIYLTYDSLDIWLYHLHPQLNLSFYSFSLVPFHTNQHIPI